MRIRSYVIELSLFLVFLALAAFNCLSQCIVFKWSTVVLISIPVLFMGFIKYAANFLLFAFQAIVDYASSSYVEIDATFHAQSPFKYSSFIGSIFKQTHLSFPHAEENLSFKIMIKAKDGYHSLVSPHYIELHPNASYRFICGKRSKIMIDVQPLL